MKIASNLSRRKFLQATGAGAGVAVLGGSFPMPAIAQSKPTELLVASGGGDLLAGMQKAFYDEYTKQTGIKIIPQPWKGLAELKVMVEAQAWGQWDMSFMSTAEGAGAEALGLSEPIDYGIVDASGLLPEVVSKNYFLTDVSASVIGWNTDSVPDDKAPKNWVEFFDPKTATPRGLWKSPVLTLDIAALGAGVPLDRLYPLDLEAAFKVLGQVRDKIVWYEGGSQSQQLLTSGEMETAMMWLNRVEGSRAGGKPVKYRFDQGLLDGDTVVIPKGHPKKAALMEFAAFLASPEPQARLLDCVPIGPSNTKAIPLCDPEKLSRSAVDPKNFALTRFQDFKWWTENNERVNAEFTKWLLG
jgi:putative spermidine/putrescine transport system substrate-binding protein